METMILIFILVSVVYISVPRQMTADVDFLAAPSPVKQPSIDVGYVGDIVLPDVSGEPGSLNDQEARLALREIVINDELSDREKQDWLDALYFKVCNCHEHGAAADVIEDIMNEGTYLIDPEWRGRHGDWQSLSMKGEG